jgi:hypothetical protein
MDGVLGCQNGLSFVLLQPSFRVTCPAKKTDRSGRFSIKETKIAHLKKSMSTLLQAGRLSVTIPCNGPQLLEPGRNPTNATILRYSL